VGYREGRNNMAAGTASGNENFKLGQFLAFLDYLILVWRF
jgi:hypothetical protein